MPVTLDRLETHWLIRLEGELTLASAPDLKPLLLEWLASGKDLQLDLERAREIDVTLLQLLLAAGREAARTGVEVESRASEAATAQSRDLGFDRFPGAGAEG